MSCICLQTLQESPPPAPTTQPSASAPDATTNQATNSDMACDAVQRLFNSVNLQARVNQKPGNNGTTVTRDGDASRVAGEPHRSQLTALTRRDSAATALSSVAVVSPSPPSTATAPLLRCIVEQGALAGQTDDSLLHADAALSSVAVVTPSFPSTATAPLPLAGQTDGRRLLNDAVRPAALSSVAVLSPFPPSIVRGPKCPKCPTGALSFMCGTGVIRAASQFVMHSCNACQKTTVHRVGQPFWHCGTCGADKCIDCLAPPSGEQQVATVGDWPTLKGLLYKKFDRRVVDYSCADKMWSQGVRFDKMADSISALDAIFYQNQRRLVTEARKVHLEIPLERLAAIEYFDDTNFDTVWRREEAIAKGTTATAASSTTTNPTATTTRATTSTTPTTTTATTARPRDQVYNNRFVWFVRFDGKNHRHFFLYCEEKDIPAELLALYNVRRSHFSFIRVRDFNAGVFVLPGPNTADGEPIGTEGLTRPEEVYAKKVFDQVADPELISFFVRIDKTVMCVVQMVAHLHTIDFPVDDTQDQYMWQRESLRDMFRRAGPPPVITYSCPVASSYQVYQWVIKLALKKLWGPEDFRVFAWNLYTTAMYFQQLINTPYIKPHLAKAVGCQLNAQGVYVLPSWYRAIGEYLERQDQILLDERNTVYVSDLFESVGEASIPPTVTRIPAVFPMPYVTRTSDKTHSAKSYLVALRTANVPAGGIQKSQRYIRQSDADLVPGTIGKLCDPFRLGYSFRPFNFDSCNPGLYVCPSQGPFPGRLDPNHFIPATFGPFPFGPPAPGTHPRAVIDQIPPVFIRRLPVYHQHRQLPVSAVTCSNCMPIVLVCLACHGHPDWH